MKEMGSVVCSKGGMVVEDPIVAHNCTYDDGVLPNDVPSSPPRLR